MERARCSSKFSDFFTENNKSRFLQVALFAEKELRLREHSLYDRNVLGIVFHFSLFDEQEHTFEKASAAGNLRVFQFLLDKERIPVMKRVPLHKIAIQNDKRSILEILMKGKRTTRSFGFQIHACEYDARECLEYLSAFNAFRGIQLKKLVLACIRSDSAKCFEFLMGRADFENDAEAFLSAAVREGSSRILSFIFSTFQIRNEVLLHDVLLSAIWWGKKGSVETLLRIGTEVRPRHLLVAQAYGETEIVELLRGSKNNAHFEINCSGAE
jgi:hypothetical protein